MRLLVWVSLTNSGKANEAIKPLEEAVKIGNNNQSMFYLASAYTDTIRKTLHFNGSDKLSKTGSHYLPFSKMISI